MLKNLPRLTDLYALISQVPTYPITASQLVHFATDNSADAAVVSFYKAFPSDVTFVDEDDLAATSEQVEILKLEERNVQEQPVELLRAPEED